MTLKEPPQGDRSFLLHTALSTLPDNIELFHNTKGAISGKMRTLPFYVSLALELNAEISLCKRHPWTLYQELKTSLPVLPAQRSSNAASVPD